MRVQTHHVWLWSLACSPRTSSHLDAVVLADPLHGGKLGPLLEGFVASELLKQSARSTYDFDLFQWRDRDGKEVDLVIELRDGTIIALEVKATSGASIRHFDGLWRTAYPGQLCDARLLHNCFSCSARIAS